MESLTDVYKYLSGVDIEKIDLADERGKGYYGEFQVFCKLFESLPPPSKMLMNLHVPTSNGKTTEIDLVAITPVGIIVYEVKNYKSTIYGSGDGKVWTQFFKNSPNCTFQNPIHQNAYHCDALYKETGMPIYSIVVFTNNDCDLRLDNINIPVCKLNDVFTVTSYILSNNTTKFNTDEINSIFEKLSSYSKMTIPVESESNLTFNDWIYMYRDGYVKYIENNKKSIAKKQRAIIIVGIASIITVISLLIAIGIPIITRNKAYYDASIGKIENDYNSSMESMKEELEDMKSKFSMIEKYDTIPLSSVVEVTDLNLQKSAENNTVLSYNLVLKDTFYKVAFNKDAGLVIKLQDGTVKQYYAFSESKRNLADTYSLYSFNQTYLFDQSLLSGIKPEDITFIKLINLDLYVKNDVYGYDEIEKKAELLIYSCES